MKIEINTGHSFCFHIMVIVSGVAQVVEWLLAYAVFLVFAFKTPPAWRSLAGNDSRNRWHTRCFSAQTEPKIASSTPNSSRPHQLSQDATTHREPASHVFGVSAMAALQTRVGRTAHRQPAQRTTQHRYAAFATRRTSHDATADRALGHELDAAARRLHIDRQIFEHLGSRHQQTPAVQQLTIRALKVVVHMSMRIAENRSDAWCECKR